MGAFPMHRQGDIRAAHTGAIAPSACLTGSSDVFVEGQAAERAGVDQYDDHGSPFLGGVIHGGTATPGSSTVFVNGSPAVRGAGGDEIDECPADGGTLIGAASVFIS
jgi:uncharacterized Zn-binding protein involved in type VI secretion